MGRAAALGDPRRAHRRCQADEEERARPQAQERPRRAIAATTTRDRERRGAEDPRRPPRGDARRRRERHGQAQPRPVRLHQDRAGRRGGQTRRRGQGGEDQGVRQGT